MQPETNTTYIEMATKRTEINLCECDDCIQIDIIDKSEYPHIGYMIELSRIGKNPTMRLIAQESDVIINSAKSVMHNFKEV